MAPGTRWSIVAAAVLSVAITVLGFLLFNRSGSALPNSEPIGSADLPSTSVEPPKPSPVTAAPIPAVQPPPRPGPRGIGGTPAPIERSKITDRFDEVDAALGALVAGNVAFNTPERMRFGESRTIALVASPMMDATALSEELRQRIGGSDPIAVAALQIAPLMEAQLEGAPAFEITALTPPRQPVSRAAPTEWRWNVKANETGKQTLHVTINAIVTVDGERFPRSISVLNRNIDVEISRLQQVELFLQGNWQWLAGTIVIPLALWFWTNRKSNHRKRRK